MAGKGRRYRYPRRRRRLSAGRQVGRQAACHKTTRTKELRRCMIRVRDERMKIGGGREEFKDVRRFTGAGGTAGKVQDTKDRREEGPTTPYRGRGSDTGNGRWRFLFKRHQRACRKFSPVFSPRFLPFPLLSSCSSRCPSYLPRPSSEVIRGRVSSTRIYTYTRCVPGWSSRVPGGSLEHRRIANAVSGSGGSGEGGGGGTVDPPSPSPSFAKRVNVVGCRGEFWRMRGG